MRKSRPLFLGRGDGVLVPLKTVKLPAKSPNLNAHAERFVRSIRSECLAKVVPLGEKHLRTLVQEYLAHYHLERNHQGLNNELIDGHPTPAKAGLEVDCRERLGGILRYYHAAAA